MLKRTHSDWIRRTHGMGHASRTDMKDVHPGPEYRQGFPTRSS